VLDDVGVVVEGVALDDVVVDKVVVEVVLDDVVVDDVVVGEVVVDEVVVVDVAVDGPSTASVKPWVASPALFAAFKENLMVPCFSGVPTSTGTPLLVLI
jgi:hypothetical protein